MLTYTSKLYLCLLGDGVYRSKVTEKVQKYTHLLAEGLCKMVPWRIWVIIDAPHPACHNMLLSGAWRVVH